MGRVKYALFILTAAVIGSGAQLAISSETGVGYSGVVYALFGYALVCRDVVPLYQTLLTTKTIRWLLGWLFLCVALTVTKVWNIANVAHFAGFAFGYCFGKAFTVRTHVKASLIGLACLLSLTTLSAVYMPWSELWKDRVLFKKVPRAREFAESGNAEWQGFYGTILLQSKTRKLEGLSWLKKSAQQGNVPAMNALAWQLATDLDASLRNGTEALRWAEKACAQDGWKSATYVDTLAAAYAELDQWDAAVATQRQAISKIPPGDAETLAACESALKKYLKHEKIRE